jgi:hypothetical protein
MVLPNLAVRKLALNVLSVATMIGIFHTARLRCRRLSRLLMHCVGEPAHDFFSEEINLNRLIVEENIVPHRDPFLPDRKLYSDPLAAMRDIKDRFDRHRRQPAGRSDARDWRVQGPADHFSRAPSLHDQNTLVLALVMLHT